MNQLIFPNRSVQVCWEEKQKSYIAFSFWQAAALLLFPAVWKSCHGDSRTLPAGWLLVGDVSHSPLHCLAGSSANTACALSAASATVNINGPVYLGTSKEHFTGYPCKKYAGGVQTARSETAVSVFPSASVHPSTVGRAIPLGGDTCGTQSSC